MGCCASSTWRILESLPRDGSVTLLDVRTREEYESGHMEGFVNIRWMSCGIGWESCPAESRSMWSARAACAVMWPADAGTAGLSLL